MITRSDDYLEAKRNNLSSSFPLLLLLICGDEGVSCLIMAVRLSGLQREVIKLYRQCLREAAKKPEVGSRTCCLLLKALTRASQGDKAELPQRCPVSPMLFSRIESTAGDRLITITDGSFGRTRLLTKRTLPPSRRCSGLVIENSSSTHPQESGISTEHLALRT
jgi:hypothetical protein